MMNKDCIIFKPPLVLAILEGRKTQTRRVIKGPETPYPKCFENVRVARDDDGFTWTEGPEGHRMAFFHAGCDFHVGQRLWVKENYRFSPMYDDLPPKNCAADCSYEADGVNGRQKAGRLRPSIFMPRRLSRITIEVTDIRAQRLQEISCADAIAEGIAVPANSQTIDCDTPDPRHGFRNLWDSINKKRGYGWDVNPWVVALTFTVHRTK